MLIYKDEIENYLLNSVLHIDLFHTFADYSLETNL